MTCSSSPAVAVRWKTCGHSTRRSWRAPCMTAACRWSVPSVMKWTLPSRTLLPTSVQRHPSAAAELVSPEQSEWLAQLHALQARSARILQQQLGDARQRLNWFNQRLQFRHPGQYLRQQAQRLDELEQRSRLVIRSYFNNLRSSLNAATAALKHTAPGYRISRTELQLAGAVTTPANHHQHRAADPAAPAGRGLQVTGYPQPARHTRPWLRHRDTAGR